MRTVCLIQTRMSSQRLPGKALALLAGRPLLDHVVTRVSQATTLDAVIVATGDIPANDPIEALCRAEDWQVFRGSEPDILDRFYQAALWAKADVIVRVSGDSPLIDPKVIDLCVRELQERGADYATNTLPPETWPDGTDCEAFTMAALSIAWRAAKQPSEREHVTPWIRSHCKRSVSILHAPDLSAYRLCIDTPEDLEAMRALMQLGGPDLTWQEAVELLRQHPEIGTNQRPELRNAAYIRQVKEEQHA